MVGLEATPRSQAHAQAPAEEPPQPPETLPPLSTGPLHGTPDLPLATPEAATAAAAAAAAEAAAASTARAAATATGAATATVPQAPPATTAALLAKLYVAGLERRVTDHAEAAGVHAEGQFGFRRHRSTEQAVC